MPHRAYVDELREQNQQLRHEVVLLQRKLYGMRPEQIGTVEQQTLFAALGAENACVAEALAAAAASRAAVDELARRIT